MENNNTRGIGLLGILQTIFIILKLPNLINWNWWIVLIPVWIDLALCGLLVFYLTLKV